MAWRAHCRSGRFEQFYTCQKNFARFARAPCASQCCGSDSPRKNKTSVAQLLHLPVAHLWDFTSNAGTHFLVLRQSQIAHWEVLTCSSHGLPTLHTFQALLMPPIDTSPPQRKTSTNVCSWTASLVCPYVNLSVCVCVCRNLSNHVWIYRDTSVCVFKNVCDYVCLY